MEMGDSACWSGHHQYLNYGFHPYSITNFEVGFGSYVRFKDPAMTDNGFGAYYKNPWQGCMSRDQLTGVIAGLIAENDIKANLRFIFHHLLSLFLFSYNTIHNGKVPSGYKLPDITFMDFWSLELRMFGKLSWVFYPLLLILDIHMFLNTIFFNLGDKDNDQINFAIKHFICIDNVPTPISLLSYRILNKEKLNRLLKDYWGGWRNQPGMHELYELKLRS
jgi:hypothetical protein